MGSRIIKEALFLTGLASAILFANLARSQSVDGVDNTVQNLSQTLQYNDVRPVRQPNFLIDSSSGSQQFFQQGKKQLYFLPEEKAKPILKIDKTVKADGVNYEDLQPMPNKK
ncbi:hypothetical protein [Pleurocapsa sp. FMAR1]|uniref:hypothetical protein n=1 Tax=Pleurocapsa sp. FMAR1 TaxID=3040204 RepID=UPI0029C70789|nr:hypothetical protein [Pleurocapsa sp. FMAR1]